MTLNRLAPITISPVSRNEVLKAVKNLDAKKSAGPDEVNPFFLKVTAEIVAGPLVYTVSSTYHYNRILFLTFGNLLCLYPC